MRAFVQRRVSFFVGAVVSLLLLCTISSFAQNLGDIARAERERRKNEPQRETHVYTNDDLEKAQILVPEDRARAFAARRDPFSPPNPTVAATVAPATPASPAVIQSQQLPAVAQQTPVASPAPVVAAVKIPAPNIPHERPLTELPVPSPRERVVAISRMPRMALVSSPTGWKTVYAQPPSPERTISARVIPTAVQISALPSEPSPAIVSHPVIASPRPVESRPAIASQPVIAPRRMIEQSKVIAIQVKRGDSLWKLAKQYLGNGLRWHDLAAVNPELSNPNLIRVGDKIQLPSNLERPTTAKQFVVHSGDTLWSLARAQFGTSLAFPCIASANPQLHSPDRIRAGDTLALPDTCALAR